jgi:hypothetical protein
LPGIGNKFGLLAPYFGVPDDPVEPVIDDPSVRKHQEGMPLTGLEPASHEGAPDRGLFGQGNVCAIPGLTLFQYPGVLVVRVQYE